MKNEAEAAKLVPHVSLREITTNPTLRIPLVISMMMMIAQQLSGINAVSIYGVVVVVVVRGWWWVWVGQRGREREKGFNHNVIAIIM